jgi:hypothetical protein
VADGQARREVENGIEDVVSDGGITVGDVGHVPRLALEDGGARPNLVRAGQPRAVCVHDLERHKVRRNAPVERRVGAGVRVRT